VLEPAERRTLRDLCEFIASGAMRPSIEPVRILGRACLPAGAFCAIRALLREAGVNVEAIGPSTSLDGYTRRHLWSFLGPISRLAPGVIPVVRASKPWYDLSSNAFLLGLLVSGAGWLFAAAPLAIAGGILALISYAGTSITSLCPPSRVEFANLRTFGDLATAIAEGGRLDGDGGQ
jgi:hypothetical protein